MNDLFPPYDSYQGFGDVDNGYAPSMPSQYDPYIFPPPIPYPPHHGPVIPILLKDLMRYIGDVNSLPKKPDSHTMAKYAEYGNRIVLYGDVVRFNDSFYIYGYNKARTELDWISFGNETSSIAELSNAVQNIQNILLQTYRKNLTSSNVLLDNKFNSLSNDFALKNELTAYATKEALSVLDAKVDRHEIFIGSHEDRLCCHAKKIDKLAVDVKSLSTATSSYVTWDKFSSKTTSAEVSAIVEGYNFATLSYVDVVVNLTSSNLSNDLTAQFDEIIQGLASDADLKKLSGDVIELSNGTNANICTLFNKTALLLNGVNELYSKVAVNTLHIENLSQDLSSFEQEVDRDYAKKNSLSVYVEKTQFNGTSDYGEKVYPVKLCADNNAYVNVPWNDKFVLSAWYEPDILTVWVEFTDGQQLSICISGLVDIYTAGYGLALSNNEFYVSADYVLRPELSNALSNYYIKSETSSAVELSTAFDAESQVFITDTESGISDVLSDLYIKKVNAEEFYTVDSKLSNTLYILTGDVLRAYGMRITDIAEPEDANDAATKLYVDDIAEEEKLYSNAVIKTVSSEITSDISTLQDDTTYISGWISSNFENTDITATTTVLKQEVKLLNNVSADSKVNVKSFNDIYASDISCSITDLCVGLSTDLSVLSTFVENTVWPEASKKIWVKSELTTDGEYSNLSVVKIAKDEYDTIVALSGDTLSNNVLYVIEGDYEDMYGLQIKNLANGTDLSDAVNKQQLDTIKNELVSYKQAVKDCVSEITAVNILTSSNIADVISSVIKIKDIIAALSAL